MKPIPSALEAEFNGVPTLDAQGVDLEQIRDFLRLTPEERLHWAEEFAAFIAQARTALGTHDSNPETADEAA